MENFIKSLSFSLSTNIKIFGCLYLILTPFYRELLAVQLSEAPEASFVNQWQVLIVPKSSHTNINKLISPTNSQPNFSDANSLLSAIPKGLSQKLGSNKIDVIANDKIFTNCEIRYCGQNNLQSALDVIRGLAPEIDLVLFYELLRPIQIPSNSDMNEPVNDRDNVTLEVTMIDPLTFKIMASDRLSLLGQPSYQALLSLAEDLGTVLLQSLQNEQVRQQYEIVLNDFVFEELNGFSTFILEKNENHYLKLVSSTQNYTMFDAYFPVTSNQYQLLSTLPIDSVQTYLTRFFKASSVDVSVQVNQSKASIQQIIVNRQGNPFAPSFLSSAILLILVLIAITWFVRRKSLDYKLHALAEVRNASDWLKTYEKATFPLYALASKYASQAIYWSRLADESNELHSQAKLYFEAGDFNTAKLFISKSLHMNTANKEAKELVKAIEEYETNTANLSKDEQWLRNKIAKALNNFRQQKPIKALKQLYQAEELAKQQKAFKKQSKAIAKLIKKVKQTFAKEYDSFTLNSTSDATSIVVFYGQKVQLGRSPSSEDLTWISQQDSVFPINHKLLSRLGYHGFIEYQDSHFYYVDLDSKNGSFLNRVKCTAQQPVLLKNKDVLQLGSKHPAQSVSLNVVISKDTSLMRMTISDQVNELLSKQELNTIWPDNVLAQSSQLACVQSQFLLALHSKTSSLRLLGVNELSDKVLKHEKLTLIAQFSLGKQSYISPMTEDTDLLIDETPIFGEIPLIIPCEIKYKNCHIKIGNYDMTSTPFNQMELLD